MRSTGRRADGRVRCLAIGWLIVVLLVGRLFDREGAAECYPEPFAAPERADLGAPSMRRRATPLRGSVPEKHRVSQTPSLENNTDYGSICPPTARWWAGSRSPAAVAC